MLTPEGFVMGMAPLVALWDKDKPPQAKLDTIKELCGHLPDEVFMLAVKEVLSTHSYGFPQPGDILDAAVRVVMQTQELSETWARQTVADWKLARVKLLVAANREKAARLAASANGRRARLAAAEPERE